MKKGAGRESERTPNRSPGLARSLSFILPLSCLPESESVPILRSFFWRALALLSFCRVYEHRQGSSLSVWRPNVAVVFGIVPVVVVVLLLLNSTFFNLSPLPQSLSYAINLFIYDSYNSQTICLLYNLLPNKFLGFLIFYA